MKMSRIMRQVAGIPMNMRKLLFIVAPLCAVVLAWNILGISFNVDTFDYAGDGTNDNPLGKIVRSTSYDFARYITNESWDELYAVSATEVRANETREEFVSNAQHFLQAIFGISEIEVVEMFVINMDQSNLKGSVYSTMMISDILPPAVHLNSPISGRQAFVLCTAKTDNGYMSSWLSMLLKQEDSDWRLHRFSVNPAKVAGHDGQWFWQKANDFEAAGQHRNAFIYAQIALLLLTPSQTIVSVSTGKIFDELFDQVPANLPVPEIRPAENWKINDSLTVKVHYVEKMFTGTILWLEVRYTSLLNDIESEQARVERRQVYDYVVKTFPEYKDAFGGIFIGSMNKNNLGNRDGFPFDETGPSLVPKWFDQPDL